MKENSTKKNDHKICDCCKKETNKINTLFYAYGKKQVSSEQKEEIDSVNFDGDVTNTITTTTTTTINMEGKKANKICNYCVKNLSLNDFIKNRLFFAIHLNIGIITLLSGYLLNIGWLKWILFISGGFYFAFNLLWELVDKRGYQISTYFVSIAHIIYDSFPSGKMKIAYRPFQTMKEMESYQLTSEDIKFWKSGKFYKSKHNPEHLKRNFTKLKTTYFLILVLAVVNLYGLFYSWNRIHEYKELIQLNIEENKVNELVEKISNQRVLANIAQNAKDEQIRKVIIEQITDQKILLKLALNTEYENVRKASLEKITDQTLVDAAKNHRNYWTRKMAIENLNADKWENLFIYLAKNDEDEFIRIKAIEKLNSDKWQDVLIDIAKNDELHGVRSAAVGKITDFRVLYDIARNDEHGFVKKDARRRIDELSY